MTIKGFQREVHATTFENFVHALQGRSNGNGHVRNIDTDLSVSSDLFHSRNRTWKYWGSVEPGLFLKYYWIILPNNPIPRNLEVFYSVFQSIILTMDSKSTTLSTKQWILVEKQLAATTICFLFEHMVSDLRTRKEA